MGSDALLHLFDYRRYREEIAPELHAFLKSGQRAQWLREALARQGREPAPPLIDYVQICTHLTPTFAWADSGAWQPWSWDEQEQRYTGVQLQAVSCESTSCPARQSCPFHSTNYFHAAEPFNALFERAVEQCLGDSVLVGRTVSVVRYRQQLHLFGLDDHHPLSELFQRLGQRGAVLGYRWGSSFEGVHGWLTPDESVTLADLLDVLPLPEHARPFAATQAALDASAQSGAPDDAFWPLSLALVRSAARLAADAGQGLLWRNV
ncbi:MAG TPA: hypothetical protein VFS21_07965 [Roseiflexaceae bacterium]|nr:hypothetical protein [Roseiflexaceae bacterium]